MDSGHPYRTRMLVRRPATPAAFNGTVLMEWMNVTQLFDSDPFWFRSWDHFLRSGYAWVGVSVQRVGIHQPGTGLKAWSPTRYGTLDVTRGGAITNDALCFDIFSQAAQAVRHPVGLNPAGPLEPQRVIALGLSQSAMRMAVYHNGIHPLAGIFDAYLLGSGGTMIRTDLSVKLFKLVTETDVPVNQAGIRQPDSDHFRRWEVAGSSHVDLDFITHQQPPYARDLGPGAPVVCALPSWSRIPVRYVFNAAIDHLVRWFAFGIPPPAAPDITTTTPGGPVIVRDSAGNALGGIRLPRHAVPTAMNSGYNSPGAPSFCFLFGSYAAFDADLLASLYRNHGAYVSRMAHATTDALKSGYLLEPDAEATMDAAAASPVGHK